MGILFGLILSLSIHPCHKGDITLVALGHDTVYLAIV